MLQGVRDAHGNIMRERFFEICSLHNMLTSEVDYPCEKCNGELVQVEVVECRYILICLGCGKIIFNFLM